MSLDRMGLGLVLAFCAAALMILYVLVLVVCHMTDNKCIISVTGTICDTAESKKIDFYKRTHTVIANFNLIAQ